MTEESASVEHTSGHGATAAQPASTAPAMRASDAERAAAADRLHTALVEGRLDIAETEDRLGAVYAARLRLELPPLLADLPGPEPASPVGGWPPVWRALVDQAWSSSARARGVAPAPPDAAQRRAATIVLTAAALWAVVCLLAGFAAGLLG
ncbi:MAG: DUF1707 domain-containing protein [Pseudonocardia sp.]|nr:DUF1707 domain-containing protein [Pseudonocardia sp.]OJY40278.1 MAG: hypothetical protein BGP03_00210 [Pseudonocardia sp. 73-21]